MVVCISVILRNITNQIPLLDLSSVHEHIEDWSRNVARTLIFAPRTSNIWPIKTLWNMFHETPNLGNTRLADLYDPEIM